VSRFHHLITDQFVVPTSEAIASREPHKSMTDLNEVNAESLSMPEVLGPIVPKCKAIMSHDSDEGSGQNVPMAHDKDEEAAESEWREQFRQRIIAARGNRTQAVMAELLGLLTNTYGKYEAPGRKSVMPVRLLPRFAKICGVSLEELIEGSKDSARKPASQPHAKPTRRKSG